MTGSFPIDIGTKIYHNVSEPELFPSSEEKLSKIVNKLNLTCIGTWSDGHGLPKT